MELAECFRRRLLVEVPADLASSQRSLLLAHRYHDDAKTGLSLHTTYRPVIVMSYTAMFHAARAILFRDGIKERSHECIPIYIRQRYPGLAGQANMLDTYRLYRHEALYGLEYDPEEEDAIVALKAAEDFLSAVEKTLTNL